MNHEQLSHNADSGTLGNANLHVLDVMRRAEQELRHLMKERLVVTKRIGTVKQTIVGLAHLFGDDGLDATLLDLVDRKKGSRQPGITGACRKILMEARQPMSARDVRDVIERTMPPLLASHKDPMATINTILGRLATYGEATVASGDRGQRVWLWAAERDRRSNSVPDA
jgi:hypothetical protein